MFLAVRTPRKTAERKIGGRKRTTGAAAITANSVSFGCFGGSTAWKRRTLGKRFSFPVLIPSGVQSTESQRYLIPQTT